MAVIAPGAFGAPFTVMQREALVPQLEPAVTHTVLVANVPNVTLMAFVPCPLLMVEPEGTVHANVTPLWKGHV